MANRTNRFDWITPALIEEHKEKLAAKHVAILTAFAGGISYATMAEDKSLNIGTVKSRLNRARAALRLLVVHPNGQPMWGKHGSLLDENGNRSIFDDVDQ